MLELVFNIIQPFPYLEETFELENGLRTSKLSLSHISTLFIVLRIYMIYKLLNHYNMWTNDRSKRIGNLLGFEANSVYATKVLLQSSPISLISLLSLLFIWILGVLIKIFEFCDVNQSDTQFNYIWNALWLNFITMATGKKHFI